MEELNCDLRHVEYIPYIEDDSFTERYIETYLEYLRISIQS